ncbi:MAG: GC-type dockerin domain-anchored protein [Phycisphaerales bacterium]
MARTHSVSLGTRAALVALGLILGPTLGVAGQASAQTTWFVDADAAPGGDGLTWATAFDDLQPALELALPGDQIWVAEGTYAPSVNDPIAGVSMPYFIMPDGVAILGGFVGTETDEAQRDPDANETIISADLLGNDITDVVIDRPADDDPDRLGPVLESKLDNAELFFFVDRTGPGTRLDGLTMTGLLKQDTGGFGPATRGGIFVIGAEFDMVNCNYVDNLGGDNAGIYITECSQRGWLDERFAGHPCVTGEAPESMSDVGVDRTEFINNINGFVPAPPFSAQTCIFADDSNLRLTDCRFEITTRFPTATTFNRAFGNSGIGGGGNAGLVEILRCEFINTGNNGAINFNLDFRAGVSPYATDIVMEDTIIRDISTLDRPIIGTLGGSFIMRRCTLVNNERRHRSTSSGIIRLAGGPGTVVQISDSMFVGNRHPVTLSVFPELATIRGCTFASNTDDINDATPAVTQQPSMALTLSAVSSVATNLIIDATTELPVNVTNSVIPGFAEPSRRIINLDPLFIRPPSDGGDGWGDDPTTPDIDESLNDDFGDLRLRPGSPAIDRADASSIEPGALDLDGNPRAADDAGIPNAAGFTLDLGAYEFQGTSCLADVNGDGVLDPADFTAWRAEYDAGGALADQNRSGAIDPGDFAAWVAKYRAGCP